MHQRHQSGGCIAVGTPTVGHTTAHCSTRGQLGQTAFPQLITEQSVSSGGVANFDELQADPVDHGAVSGVVTNCLTAMDYYVDNKSY